MHAINFKRYIGIAILALLIAIIHFWLMSIDFYQPHRTWVQHANEKKGRSTIAALWASSSSQSFTPSKTTPSSAANSTVAPSQPQLIRQPRSSIFSVGSRSAQASAEDPFISSQKLREQTLRNEETSRNASTKTAMRDLKDILFERSGLGKAGQKNCCVVAAIQPQATCNSSELSNYYQSIFESLKPRLNELAREGIVEFCE